MPTSREAPIMYHALRTPTAGAGDHYRSIDLVSRIEAASPHRLIGILYEELILSLAGIKMAIRRRDLTRVNEGRARAQSIVQTLDAGLDHDKGGSVAAALTSVYGEVNHLIGVGCRTMEPVPIEEAQAVVAEISEAWNRIG